MEGFPVRILLAIDGSENAALAARTATDLSERAGSEVHIVHVLPQFPRYAYPGVTPQICSRVLDETLQGARDLSRSRQGTYRPWAPGSRKPTPDGDLP